MKKTLIYTALVTVWLMWGVWPCVAVSASPDAAALPPEPIAVESYSVAGFVPRHEYAEDRLIYGMNVGWQYAVKSGFIDVPQSVNENDGGDTGDKEVVSWTWINLPHTFRHHLNYEKATEYSIRLRKEFTAPPELAGRRNILYFESGEHINRVFINGTQVEPRENVCAVALDVSKHLKPGQKNLIEVDSSCNSSIFTGRDFHGISSNVYLISTGQVYITGGEGEAGILFRTEQLDAKKKTAKVSVRIQVANDSDEGKKVRVHALMTDPRAYDPTGDTEDVALPPHSKKTLKLNFELENVRPWTPESPNLYHLGIEIWSDEGGDNSVELLDSQTLRVGIRTMQSGKDGFLLNGKQKKFEKLVLISAKKDDLISGEAMPVNRQWLTAMKINRAGIKAVLLDPGCIAPSTFLDACDKFGVAVFMFNKDASAVPAPALIRNRASAVVFPTIEDFQKVITNAALKEGLIDLKQALAETISEEEAQKAGKPVAMRLRVDREGEMPYIANGSDEWNIIAELTDAKGKRVPFDAKNSVQFTVEGPAELVKTPPDEAFANPWGATFKVRVAAKPGKVKVSAVTRLTDAEKEVSAVLEFDTAPTGLKMLFSDDAVGKKVEPTESTATIVKEQPKPQVEESKPQEPQDEEPLPPLYPEETPPTIGQLIRKALDSLFPWPFGCANQ